MMITFKRIFFLIGKFHMHKVGLEYELTLYLTLTTHCHWPWNLNIQIKAISWISQHELNQELIQLLPKLVPMRSGSNDTFSSHKNKWRVRSWILNPLGACVTYQLKTKYCWNWNSAQELQRHNQKHNHLANSANVPLAWLICTTGLIYGTELKRKSCCLRNLSPSIRARFKPEPGNNIE